MCYLRFSYTSLLILLSIFCWFGTAAGQSVNQDFSTIHVNDLSDGQIKQMLQQADAAGYSDAQVVQLARQKGLPANEAQDLEKRISDIRGKKSAVADTASSATTTSPRRLNYQSVTGSTTPDQKTDVLGEIKPKIYGAEIFRNSNISFSPDLKIATPVNYILGPEDQIVVNVYGKSLANWKLDVSPEGNINIPGIGLVNVAGKTIEQASALIKGKLTASNYAVGNGTTVQITLGNIRSIKVIMVGELVKPGTYTLPSLATVFNALYSAGGPNDNGSMRSIEIIRNNKIIRHLDVYDFLLKGDQKDNIRLEDQDIVRVPTYRTRVEMAGEVKNPALFEVLHGETLQSVINFAGGFTDLAYTSRIKVLQVNDQQRRITDVLEADYKNYIPLRGDKYVVDRILERFENRVAITGAIFRPGDYELEKGLTLSGLLQKSAGLREDAFTGRGSITRLNPDNSRQFISFDVRAVLNKTAADIPLQREDSVHIASKFDLRDKYVVTINGEVRKPGKFDYADSMKVADLIVMAGGFAEGATAKRIEVSRRIDNANPMTKNSSASLVFSVDLDANLSLSSADFTLKPYDIVSVYGTPGYEKQRTVKVTGEVLYPGYYTIQTKNEKISDIITRAGGLTAFADVDGSSLKRENSVILGSAKGVDTTELARERQVRLAHVQSAIKDSTDLNSEQLRNNYVGIDLKKILEKPGSVTDLILENGDEIRVPKQQQIVRVNGEVLYPSLIVYERGKSFKDYVFNAGGFSSNAQRSRAYIVYPNGSVQGTRKFLFFNSYPSVKPGSEIYIPKKPTRHSLTTGEVIGLTSGLASVAAVILGILSLHK